MVSTAMVDAADIDSPADAKGAPGESPADFEPRDSDHAAPTKLKQEDLLRAQIYTLLSHLLIAPPGKDLLAICTALRAEDAASHSENAGPATPESGVAAAINRFANAAGSAAEAELEEDYERLFIGLGRGTLVPYGSYYLTGFLNEKPLAQLRDAMVELGAAQIESRSEPEDHAGSLLEVMAGLITNRYRPVNGQPVSLAAQQAFFKTHINNWMPHLFKDLEQDEEATAFYQALGALGREFLALEAESFEMLSPGE